MRAGVLSKKCSRSKVIDSHSWKEFKNLPESYLLLQGPTNGTTKWYAQFFQASLAAPTACTRSGGRPSWEAHIACSSH